MSSFTGAAAAVTDRDYVDVVHAAVERARRRVWASVFLVDPRPSRDVAGLVLDLLEALAERRRVGVDVRVLVSAEVATPDIAVANRATALYLGARGVPVRHLGGDATGGRRGSHAKIVVVDGVAVVGSQNWTDDAFRLNAEDAALVVGPPAELLAASFRTAWHRGLVLR